VSVPLCQDQLDSNVANFSKRINASGLSSSAQELHKASWGFINCNGKVDKWQCSGRRQAFGAIRHREQLEEMSGVTGQTGGVMTLGVC